MAVDPAGIMMVPGIIGEGQPTPAWAKYVAGVTVSARCLNNPLPKFDATDDKMEFNSRFATSMFSKLGLPRIVASSACGNPTRIVSGSVIGPLNCYVDKH